MTFFRAFVCILIFFVLGRTVYMYFPLRHHHNVYFDRKGHIVGTTPETKWFGQDHYFIEGTSRAPQEFNGRHFWEFEPIALRLVKQNKIRAINESFTNEFSFFISHREKSLSLREIWNYSPEGSAWDYKQQLDGQDFYMFHGKMYLRDYIGNVIWAMIMKHAGWPQCVSLSGAGIYQTATGQSTLKFWIENPFCFGDDPRDSQGIRAGYLAY